MKPNYMKSGYLLAFKEFNNSSWAKSHNLFIDLVDFEVGTKDIDLIKAFLRAVDSDVLAVVGLETSKEALLVATLAQKHELLTLTASAAHDAIGLVGDYVYSGSNPISSTVKAMDDYMHRKNTNQVLIITNFDEPYSKKYADELVQSDYLKNKSIVRLDLPEGQMLNEEHLIKIKEKKYDAVIITTYSYSGVMILNELVVHSVVVNQPVLVSQVWYFDHEIVKEYLKKPYQIVCMAPWYNAWQDDLARKFIQKYRNEYSKDPISDDAHTYDMADILLEAIKSGNYSSRLELKESFKKIKAYRGVTGWFHYDACSNHPRKNFFVVQMNRNKEYELVDIYMRGKTSNCN